MDLISNNWFLILTDVAVTLASVVEMYTSVYLSAIYEEGILITEPAEFSKIYKVSIPLSITY
jgi:hypothetical protein